MQERTLTLKIPWQYGHLLSNHLLTTSNLDGSLRIYEWHQQKKLHIWKIRRPHVRSFLRLKIFPLVNYFLSFWDNDFKFYFKFISALHTKNYAHILNRLVAIFLLLFHICLNQKILQGGEKGIYISLERTYIFRSDHNYSNNDCQKEIKNT